MANYKVLTPIQAGERYEIGDLIELTPAQAKELIAINAVGPKPVKAETPPPPPPPAVNQDPPPPTENPGKPKK